MIQFLQRYQRQNHLIHLFLTHISVLCDSFFFFTSLEIVDRNLVN